MAEAQRKDSIDYADRLWSTLEERYPFLLREMNTDITEKRKQLKNKEVIISVFGRHNCGKSTLLNAMLRNSLLPTNMDNETGIEIKIRHDPAVHCGPCIPTNCAGNTCPRLVEEPGGATVAIGAEEIETRLQRENSTIRQTGVVVSKDHSFVLYTFVSILEDAPEGWNQALLDTPGFGEANVKNVTARTNTLFTTSTAYLYIIDNTIMGDEVDEKKIQALYKQDKDLFNDSRFVVAISKFDQRFSQDTLPRKSRRHRPPTEANIGEKLKEKARSFISESVKCDPPPNVEIVPVSAVWADIALCLRTEPCDEDIKEAEDILRKYPDPPPQGQGESSAIDVASSLDTICGLPILEIRLKSVIKQCIEIWRKSLTKAYTGYLVTAKSALEDHLQTLTEEKQRVSGMLKLHERFDERKNQLFCMGYYEGNEKPEIEVRLERKYTEIDEPTAKDLLHGRINTMISHLIDVLKAKVDNPNTPFLQRDFHKEIKSFLDEEAEPTLRAEQPHIKLEGVAATFRDAIEEMNQLDFEIGRIVAEILPKDWSPPSDKLRKDRDCREEKNIISTEVLENRQLTLNDLHQHISTPPLEVGVFQRFLDWIKKKFGGTVTPREDRPYKTWTPDMDKAVGDLKLELTRAVDEYITSTLKKWVIVEVIGVAYRNRVKTRAEAVGETYTSSIRKARSKTDEERAKCAPDNYMERLAADIATLQSSIDQLNNDDS